ncbi:hypothetical protein GCM10010301_32850 [Streptomyces plicatus]|nr:hypothetical protein GCM10010301_32850 [Streptomyces plicatus]
MSRVTLPGAGVRALFDRARDLGVTLAEIRRRSRQVASSGDRTARSGSVTSVASGKGKSPPWGSGESPGQRTAIPKKQLVKTIIMYVLRVPGT